MQIFKEIKQSTHEKVIYFHDPLSNLKAIIAVHNTALGPSLGGCRMMPYLSEDEALADVLRLSEGMTYKAAMAGLHLGGGKAVILADPQTDKNENLLKAFGRFVNRLDGKYITAEDMGMTVKDMEIIKKTTDYVTGLSQSLGGSGDPSDFTSYGAYVGIKAATKFKFQKKSLDGLSIVVQGLGNVGIKLINYLSEYDMKIYVSDVDPEKIKKCISDYNVIAISNDEIYDLEADIFCPCAIGAVINDKTIKNLKYKIIAGAANNILKDYNKHGQILLDKDILYAPDYVINAGGLINIYNELQPKYDRSSVYSQVDKIYDSLTNIFEISQKENKPTNKVSDNLAIDIINCKKESLTDSVLNKFE